MDLSPRLRAYLALIAYSEGTSTSPITQDKGYDVIVSGTDGPHRMADYDDHPFAPRYGRPIVIVRDKPLLQSTASGRYQLLYHWWATYKITLRLTDFGHDAQDAVAIQQMKERHALDPVADGDVRTAIKRCSNIWASFPGNDYSQPGGHTLEDLVAKYASLTAAV